MCHAPQIKVNATYMRGGTSKGVFFKLTDLPNSAQQAGEARDRLLLRVIGSPDPYQKHTDGMGGATSSTSKTALEIWYAFKNCCRPQEKFLMAETP